MSLFPPESLATMKQLITDSLDGEVEFVIPQGAPVNDSGDVYDPLTDTWSSGPPPAGLGSISHKFDAEQIKADPTRFSAMGLSLLNSIVLKVQPDPENDFEPSPGMKMVWPSGSGKNFVVKTVDPIAPEGAPLLWYVYATGGAQAQ